VGLVSDEGNICIWPLDDEGVGEIILERVAQRVTAVSAAAIGEAAFLLVATDDSSLHLVAVSLDGTSAAMRKLGGAEGETPTRQV
jgi:hypothetical protein